VQRFVDQHPEKASAALRLSVRWDERAEAPLEPRWQLDGGCGVPPW
jgi:hypothetical protein